MFRVTTCVFSIKHILYCRPLLDHRVACFTRFTPRYANVVKPGDPKLRDPCVQPPPPPPKPPRDDKWIWITLTALLISGVGIVAAKSSPEIRDFLTLYAPWVDDIIAVLYEENYSYGEMAMMRIDDLKSYITDITTDKEIKEISTDGKTVTCDVPTKEELEKAEEATDDEEQVCEPPPPPVVTQSICDIEDCLKELGDYASDNYYTAKEACAYYNSLVDETMHSFTHKGLKQLRFAKKERKGLVKESLKNAKSAIARLDEMYRYLDCGVQASKEEIDNTKLMYHNYKQIHKASRIKFEWENDKAIARDRLWQMVESVIDRYSDEVESIYPGVKLDSKKPRLDGNPDMLLYSTYRYVNHLSDELDDSSAAISERVNRAYDMLPGSPEVKAARDKELLAVYTLKKAELAKEFAEREAKQKANNDKLLIKLTQKQMKKHIELLEKRLKQKEDEIRGKMAGMVSKSVEKEKRIFKAQLDDMARKLEIVEAKLEIRLKAERDARRSQELWAAASALLAATRKGGPRVDVNKELNAIEKASEGEDKLVLTVLKSIPDTVREKGIVPESMLRAKYNIMEDTALKVALVEEDGGAMPVYILSWLQSILLFMKIRGIPQNEFEKPPKEPADYLDTFDLLQRARFWMDQGNLAIALRYVDSLKGASRLAAHRWYETAKEHLEVRQAAEAVLAHAAALGLQYI